MEKNHKKDQQLKKNKKKDEADSRPPTDKKNHLI